MNEGVSTCLVSLEKPGECCWSVNGLGLGYDCSAPAVVAVLAETPDGLVECSRCAVHLEGTWVASKPMPAVSEEWA